MLYKDNDKFLINRGVESYYAEALELKNLVNPTGSVDKPDILTPIEGQGTPIPLDVIDKVEESGGNTLITVASNKSLHLLGPADTPINKNITQTQIYNPVSTDIYRIDDLGTTPATYELYFKAVDYDFKYFQVGDTVKTSVSKTEGEIVARDTSKKTLTIESEDSIWLSTENQRIIHDEEYQGTGNLVSYTMNGSRAVLTVSGATDYFVPKYNNRNQQITIDTDEPVGGFQVSTDGFDFTSTPFGSTDPVTGNPFLTLTGVTWYVNGDPYKGDVDLTGIQTWNPGPGVIQEGINTVQVKYTAGLNFSFSDIVKFEASSTSSSTFFIDRKITKLSEMTTEVIALGL